LTETEIQRDIFDFLISIGWLAIRINSGSRGKISFYYWQAIGQDRKRSGVSDIIGLTPWDQFYIIECKAPGKLDDTSEDQESFLDCVNHRGGAAIVADNLNVVIEWTERLRKLNL
jgi:hypothetical protein